MKYLLLTDIHFGLKSNSDKFNQECLDFLDFVRDWSDENLDENFETIFLGDWYHSRNQISVNTLNYAKEGLITLSNIGVKQYMLLGNHDLFYKESRGTTSVIIPEEATGIEVITEPVKINDNMLLVPWMIGNENLKDLITEYSPKYTCCHAEIPSFSFNKKVKMDGEFNPEEYAGPKRILSGHFHLRQENGNITYIGNCFSHDYSDSNEWHNKGFAVLDTDTNEIQYIEWDKAPKYLVCPISVFNKEMIEDNMYLRLLNDINLKMEDVNKIMEEIKKDERINECVFVPIELDITGDASDIDIENVDNINVLVSDLLTKVEAEHIDNNKLISIYNGL